MSGMLPEKITAIQKTQAIRIADVFIIGPSMIAGGLMLKTLLLGKALAIFGIATVIYNANNYFKQRKGE